MTSGHIGSSRDNRRRWTTLALVAGCLSLSACASMAKVSTDATTILQTHIVRPVRYRLAAEPSHVLARAKDAYAAARFRDALRLLRAALIDLEDLSDGEMRVKQLAETRCYLAFTYFANQERERVRDELKRLATLDGALASCTQQAPPGVRSLIADVQRKRP